MNTNDYTKSERAAINAAWAWLELMAEKSGHSESDLLERAYLMDRGSRGSFSTAKVVLMRCAYDGMVSRGEWGERDAFDAPGCILARCVGMRLHADRAREGYSADFARFSTALARAEDASKAHTARLVAAV